MLSLLSIWGVDETLIILKYCRLTRTLELPNVMSLDDKVWWWFNYPMGSWWMQLSLWRRPHSRQKALFMDGSWSNDSNPPIVRIVKEILTRFAIYLIRWYETDPNRDKGVNVNDQNKKQRNNYLKLRACL